MDSHDPTLGAAPGDLGQRMKRALPHLALVVCLLVFSVRAVTSMVQESATWDETHYFALGKYLLQHGAWNVSGSILHPPFSYYVQSLPLLFVPTDSTVFHPIASPESHLRLLAGVDGSDTIRGQVLLSSPLNHDDRLLTLSRLTMVFVALLLGCFVYLWSYSLYGARSAVFAAVLFTFCPNMLAHARLITPDIVLTTFSLLTVYFLWRLCRSPRLAYALLGGASLGLTLLSKFTGALLVPVALLLVLLWWVKKGRPSLARVACFFAVGIVVLFLGYGLDLTPYVQGIRYQRELAGLGHPSFLLGSYSDAGWWYYVLASIVMKTPLAVLAFVGISIVVFVGKVRSGAWIDEAFLLLPAIAFVAFFSFEHQATGLRYVLPIFPLLYVFSSRAVEALWSKATHVALFAALGAWYLGASWYIHPHYLAYFNELAGGPSNGYRCLVDSNLDWGQDLKGLGRFMERNNIPRIRLSYFGSDSPQRYGIAYDWLPSVVLVNPSPEKKKRAYRHGWFAISATNLQGVYFENKSLFAWLRDKEPVARLGYSIFVYHVEGEDAEP